MLGRCRHIGEEVLVYHLERLGKTEVGRQTIQAMYSRLEKLQVSDSVPADYPHRYVLVMVYSSPNRNLHGSLALLRSHGEMSTEDTRPLVSKHGSKRILSALVFLTSSRRLAARSGTLEDIILEVLLSGLDLLVKGC